MQKLFCDSGHSGFCIFLICSVINHFHYFLNTKIILCFCAQWRKSIHLPSFPTVLLRRILFLRKHHPMDFPPFCLAARSLSSSSFVLIVLWCPHSDLRCTLWCFLRIYSCFPGLRSFRNLPSNVLPLLSDRCDDPKEDCSILFPILHLSGFRFQIMSGFYSSGESALQICDLSKYPMLWFITSLCVLNCGTYSIVTD